VLIRGRRFRKWDFIMCFASVSRKLEMWSLRERLYCSMVEAWPGTYYMAILPASRVLHQSYYCYLL
jgi:hypothetical protein